ncbi:MAG: hypothetical protein Athens101410_325 [Parcubacteria group bacterium Athens1014_10]|nr:MAG: hypothetical protein Athens101410_325 [Parcubacteria group bacterium Athens1014_10]TSD04220.1 MAG: hypothetical protein Athens071412_784 [Parcubacteria group bacterium Athens0714_12]
MKNKIKKVVTIGGGSGQFVLLSGLKNIKEISISAIVSMVDSGGSTGRLRDELGILPPGDILKCILALSSFGETARKILQTRFKNDDRLQGHNAGNMLLTVLSQYTGNFPAGVKALSEILAVKGKILPVTINKATLVAELTDGSRLYGESAIDVPRGNQREKIKDVFLVPHHNDSIKVYPPVIKAIKEADYIIIGPGDIYTSIVPNFLVSGVKKALSQSKAKLIYVANIMTKFGETDNFCGHDFVSEIEQFIKKKLDLVIFNSQKPSENILKKYAGQKAYFVEAIEKNKWQGKVIIKKDLLDVAGGVVRHDPKKLSGMISQIINNKNYVD